MIFILHCRVQTIKTVEERIVSNEQLKALYDIIENDHHNKSNYIPPYAVKLVLLQEWVLVNYLD